MWVSPFANEGGQRLGLEECPVSFVTGESQSFVDDFLAHLALGASESIRSWPARRVDAFAVLHGELRQIRK